MNSFTAAVSRIRDVTHDVRLLELQLIEPSRMHFVPGQFVSFEVTRPELPYPLTRAYSIASPPDSDGRIELLVNCVGGVGGSAYLFGLEPGQLTTFRGPSGSFTLKSGTRDLLFVATGTGIAPIRSMLWSLAHTSSARNITLFWGLRSERDLYLQDELEQLHTALPRFSFVTTLSQPAAGWTGATGRVDALVESRISSVSGLDVFLCGNSAMIGDITALLRRKGLCPIHTERYYDDRTQDRRLAG
jgi:NAD(P)H-flavin reductase